MSEPLQEQGTSGSVRPLLEVLTAHWVVILALIYASGYGVVAIYNASMGFNDINLLRPHTAAAGLLFILLLAIAIYGLRYCKMMIRQLLGEPQSETQRYFLMPLLGLVLLCGFDWSAVGSTSAIFHFEDYPTHHILVSLLPIPSIGFFAISGFYLTRKRALPKWAVHWFTLSILFLLIVTGAVTSFPYRGEFDARQVVLFFLFVQIMWQSSAAIFAVKELRESENLLIPAANLILAMVFYGFYVYPHLRGAFGGGQPTEAQVHLSTEGNGKSERQLQVEIIDETDNGYYVSDSKQSKVIFIPRRLVTAVEFQASKGMF